MQKILIDGGGTLRGTVKVSGAKNSCLPVLMTTILAEGEHRIRNTPDLVDVRTTCKLLEGLGAEVSMARGTVRVAHNGLSSHEAPYDLVKTMRASVVCLGPLVGRYGRARVSLPGGCAIGARPIDQHLKGLEKLGAKVSLSHGYVEVTAKRLRGNRIVLDQPTVTGTENLLMAAVLAKGETEIRNAAREPEVLQVAEVLNQMGAKIEGAGTQSIWIQGVDSLAPARCTVIPDRIEVGTLMVASVMTGGKVLLRGARADHQTALIEKLTEAGAIITVHEEGIHIRAPGRPKPVDLTTQPYPGFPTDMQAQFMALMAVADGTSIISEHIFENRFMHVSELNRMGAKIKFEGARAVVQGVRHLSGAQVMATDLRASASLVLAGLIARGRTEIYRIYHLDRGYQRLDKKLRKLGAHIRRSQAQPPTTVT